MKKKIQTDQIKDVTSDAEVWKAKYLRALADYQNLEKRTHEHVAESRNYASSHIIRTLLPVLDNLERAGQHLADDGLTHIVRQFHTVLTDAGVSKIEVVGKPFDPETMECVSLTSGKEGIVMEELTAGYTMLDKVIRPAHVKVGSGVAKEKNQEEKDINVSTNN